jgi:hypothetical protein
MPAERSEFCPKHDAMRLGMIAQPPKTYIDGK